MNKNILAGFVGEILEWYDFSLYGFLSPIFAQLFFPAQNKFTSVMTVLFIFAVGFMARPLGGLLLGWWADQHGRKSAFSLSLFFMGISTFLMGCLPTYQSVGWFAPLLLLVLRLLQGFSCGGEFSISMVFLSEHANKKNYYFFGSFAWMGTMLGALIASVIILLLSFDADLLLKFAWRFPFFLGGLIAIAAFYIRSKTEETPVYIDLEKKAETFQRWRFLKKNKRCFFKIISLNVTLAIVSYVGVAYFPLYLTHWVGLSFSSAFLINVLLMISLIVLIPCAGKLADKITGELVYKIALLGFLVVSFPVYALLSYGGSWFTYGLAIFLFALPAAFIKAVMPGLSVKAAPCRDRAVLMSFAYNCVYCFLGGTAPLLMSYGIEKWHFLLLPAVYIIIGVIFSWYVFVIRSAYFFED